MRKMGEEVYVIAKYDYKAETPQELDIRKSEKLLLLDDSKHWWKVQNNRLQAGFVPSNFVKKAKPSIFSSLKNTLGRRKGSETRSQLSQGARNGSEPSSDVEGYPELLCDSIPRVAKYSYKAQRPDELSLNKGETVIVLEKSSDGWWKGRKEDTNGIIHTGWFPSNYVETEELGNYCHPPDNRSAGSVGEFGKFSSNGDCMETVVALYRYVSCNSEELSFEKDEHLEILDKPSADPEWWKARNMRGEIGLVPRNYVQTLSTDSGFPRITPESQSNSSLSGHSSHGASSRTPSGGLRSRFRISGPLADKMWYYGNITRAECDQMLNAYAQDGDFIVRDSETNLGDFTITLKAPDRNKHFRIHVENNSYNIGQQSFDSIDDLVEHYKKHPIYKHETEKLYLLRAFTHHES